MYAAGEANDYDLLGYHPYALTLREQWADPAKVPYGIAIIDNLNVLRASHGDTRPYAFTEIGFDTSKVATATAAKWLPRQSTAMTVHTEHQWLFCWRDTIGDGGKYGLVDGNDKPKTALYDAVKPLLSE